MPALSTANTHEPDADESARLDIFTRYDSPERWAAMYWLGHDYTCSAYPIMDRTGNARKHHRDHRAEQE